MSADRRKYPRLRFDLPLNVEAGHSLFVARASDISEGGVFIKTTARIAQGARIRMRLHLGAAVVVCDGDVRWQLHDTSGARHGVGVQFSDLSPTALATIRRFVREHAPDLYASPNRVSAPPRPDPTAPDTIDFSTALR
jgi:uncharacterized protein (TIGR02266 family)